MGSQILEILRQGIWASLTGGWFYDPHLDVFSNTFHLYVWLFLLCLPFTIYLYFPITFYVWLCYCSSVIVLFGTIKSVNFALHCMYDTTECLEEPNQNNGQEKLEGEKKWEGRSKRRDQLQDQGDLGIELQVLNGKTDTPPVECSSRNSYIDPNSQNADADSITSDYTRDKPNSTIDLKVEIHRKNSSESSEESAQLNKPILTSINIHKAELVTEFDCEQEYRSKCYKKSKAISKHTSEHYPKTNNLGKTGSESQIKQTGSLELEQTDDFQYWKYNRSTRRLNSNSIPMEAQLVNQHPQSLEIIGYYVKSEDAEKNEMPSHPQSLEVISKSCHPQLIHPASLETIRSANKIANQRDENNLPLHPQSLETINAKKILPQLTLKRHQLQMLPHLSCGSEIVHPIAEQSDEQMPSDNSQHIHNQDSIFNSLVKVMFNRRENDNVGSSSSKSTQDPCANTRGYDDRFSSSKYISDANVDNDSANSRDALLEESKPRKRAISSTSQSSWDISNEQRNRERCIRRCGNDEPINSGSIVGLDWLFDNGDAEAESCPWTTKNISNKEPDSGSSSTTTLSLDNEVKRKLLPQPEMEHSRLKRQGAIPKLKRVRRTNLEVTAEPSHSSEARKTKCRRSSHANTERRQRSLKEPTSEVKSLHLSQLSTSSNNELSTLLQSPSRPLLAALLNNSDRDLIPAPLNNNSISNANNNSHQTHINSLNVAVNNNYRRTRPRCRQLHRYRTRRRPRYPHQDQDFIALSRFLFLTSNREIHDDTLPYFKDDYGRWLVCALDEKDSSNSGANASQLPPVEDEKLLNLLLRQQLNQNLYSEGNWFSSDYQTRNSCSSLSLNSAGLTVIIDTPPSSTPPLVSSPVNGTCKIQNQLPSGLISISSNGNGTSHGLQDSNSQRFPFRQILTDAERNRRLQNLLGTMESSNHLPAETNNQHMLPIPQENWNRFVNEFIGFDEPVDIKSKPTRHYYKWKIGKLPHIKIRFDRLSLLALLDRNLTILETFVSVLLAIAVAGLALTILQKGFYRDVFAFLFCFVVAGCQYSLLKSVQPDASSPTHGFNRVVVFSRSIYFILCSGIILILDESLKNHQSSNFKVYGIDIFDYNVILVARNIMLIFLLSFPVLFSLGLFPQINTFIMYFCEHIDIHIFGGNATTSLVSSIYSLSRSILTVLILYAFAYGSLTEPKFSQHILFSIFAGLLVAASYHLSRSSSDPSVIWDILKTNLWPPDIYLEGKQAQVIENTSRRDNTVTPAASVNKSTKAKSTVSKKKDVKVSVNNEQISESEHFDPLPQKLRSTVKSRLKHDLIVCLVIGILSFAIHSSSIFVALQPELNPVLWSITATLGFLLHYILPQLRKQLPWLCLAQPVLKSYEHSQFEVQEPVRITWTEKLYVCLCFVERNLLYPLIILGALTECSSKIAAKFGESLGALVIVICSLKSLRSAYSDPSTRYLVLIFSVFLFKLDFHEYSETFLVDYFVTAIGFSKIHELLLKIRFVVTYIAPWQITWGSAFHAFAQPFSVPHSAMLFLQAGISAILSTPLNPLLGSAIFISSYVRPIKFWERDYKTRRVDHSNTRMSLHLERNLGSDDNNLNSIFYEQLTRSLQHSLYGDLALGRWGNVEQGDCFLLASDYLNCLVHVIQLGNGLVTFQLRGLEFRGTYCQQREVEAISEGIEDNDNCCCFEIGHPSHILSVNAAFSQRWLAWEVATSKYVLEGYSISDNSAVSMLQVFDFRKVLVTYYVKSIIFYAIKSQKLKQWLDNQEIIEALKPTLEKNFVDLDPVFNMNIDEDFDYRASGITRSSFCNVYFDWIQFCAIKQDKALERSRDSYLVSLCLGLSLLGRRVLGAASHNTISSVEFFLHGLHALFKGDFRITSVRDEWVLHDVDLLRNVVAKGVRMALKLHQDHFMSPDTYEEASALYEAIDNHDHNLVISHEADPLWRNAILSGAPSLLALRHVIDDGIDEYKVIMLNKRFLSFRVIKINRECVRGLWAGQQQELVYLRNRDPERGSIQNAKQALRNIINSSCDQPIGYPIYVSPLTTSYAETNEQLSSITGGSITLGKIKNNIFQLWQRTKRRCGQGCSSGGTGSHDDGGFGNDGVYSMTTYNIHSGYSQSGHNTSGTQSMESSCQASRGSLGRGNTSSVGGTYRGSLASMGKPTTSTLASLAGLLSSGEIKLDTKSETSFTAKVEREEVLQRVRILDPNQVYDAINLGRRIDVIWPDEKMRQQGGRSGWQHWVPERDMMGFVVHKWIPNHRDPNRRSHVDKIILLVKIEDKYVPIAEQGVVDLEAEV